MSSESSLDGAPVTDRGAVLRTGEPEAAALRRTPWARSRSSQGGDGPRAARRGPIAPRLIQRASATRWFLAAMVAAGGAGALLTLAQAWLLQGDAKRALAEAARSTSPAGLPVELPDHAARFRLLVKGAELASEEERARNPRATPVRLRAAERVRAAA